MNFQRGQEKEPLEINLVPLIDVMMVILIFLMISTTYSKYTELQITLPTAESEKQPERANEVSVLVNAEGHYVINRSPVPFRNSTAHQGLLQERFASPIPLHVLGDSKGRRLTPQELTRKFAQALFVRTPNQYGCVALHRSLFYVDQGLAQQPVLLWVAGEELRAVYDHVLVAEYTCHYDLRTGTVTRLRLGQWYPSPFAARQAQGALLERTPQDSVIVVRPPAVRLPTAGPGQAEQLRLFVGPRRA